MLSRKLAALSRDPNNPESIAELVVTALGTNGSYYICWKTISGDYRQDSHNLPPALHEWLFPSSGQTRDFATLQVILGRNKYFVASDCNGKVDGKSTATDSPPAPTRTLERSSTFASDGRPDDPTLFRRSRSSTLPTAPSLFTVFPPEYSSSRSTRRTGSTASAASASSTMSSVDSSTTSSRASWRTSTASTTPSESTTTATWSPVDGKTKRMSLFPIAVRPQQQQTQTPAVTQPLLPFLPPQQPPPRTPPPPIPFAANPRPPRGVQTASAGVQTSPGRRRPTSYVDAGTQTDPVRFLSGRNSSSSSSSSSNFAPGYSNNDIGYVAHEVDDGSGTEVQYWEWGKPPLPPLAPMGMQSYFRSTGYRLGDSFH